MVLKYYEYIFTKTASVKYRKSCTQKPYSKTLQIVLYDQSRSCGLLEKFLRSFVLPSTLLICYKTLVKLSIDHCEISISFLVLNEFYDFLNYCYFAFCVTNCSDQFDVCCRTSSSTSPPTFWLLCFHQRT